jgi:zinc protease
MELKMKSAIARILVLVCASFMTSLTVLAQAPAKSTAAPAAAPSADQILDKYVEATGGSAAWKKFTSRQSIGTLEIPAMNLSGTFQVHEKAPNSMLSVVVVAGATFRQGFDGKVGWSDDPQNGVREQTGPELNETKRQADFYRPLDLRQLYTKFTVTGTEKVGDHDAYVVEARPAQGEADKMYFDTQSGLIVKMISQRHSPQGVVNLTEELSDYRDADGVKLPFTILQSTAENSFTIKITEVHHNLSFDDAQFAKPAAQ